MTDIEKEFIRLINEGYTINDIIGELGLSFESINLIIRNLKQIGIEFNKKFYYDGEIIYSLNKNIDVGSKKNFTSIITEPECDVFKAMILSDLHIGSDYERMDLWNKIYDYCIINGINIIINAGDFLDGINIGRIDSKKHNNALEQFEYAVLNYPFDKNILNFTVLGNHDIDSLCSSGINFATYLENFRYDIIPIGYGFGRINIKNDKILVTHPLCIGLHNNLDLTSNYLLIKGHHHLTKTIIGTNGNCSLSVPSLSNIFLNDDQFLPGAIVLNIKFKHGYFDTVYLEHLLINERINIVNSIQYSITPSKDRKNDGVIRHEEKRQKKRILEKK